MILHTFTMSTFNIYLYRLAGGLSKPVDGDASNSWTIFPNCHKLDIRLEKIIVYGNDNMSHTVNGTMPYEKKKYVEFIFGTIQIKHSFYFLQYDICAHEETTLNKRLWRNRLSALHHGVSGTSLCIISCIQHWWAPPDFARRSTHLNICSSGQGYTSLPADTPQYVPNGHLSKWQINTCSLGLTAALHALHLLGKHKYII